MVAGPLVVFSLMVRIIGEPLLPRYVFFNRVRLTANPTPCTLRSLLYLPFQYRLRVSCKVPISTLSFSNSSLMIAVFLTSLMFLMSTLRLVNIVLTFHVPSVRVDLFCFCNFPDVKICSQLIRFLLILIHPIRISKL